MVQEMTLFSPGPSIYGGTDQVQRNIIGERVLGLPKEPGPGKDTPFRDLLVNTESTATRATNEDRAWPCRRWWRGWTGTTLLAWMREVDAGPFSVLAAGERIAYPNQEMMSAARGRGHRDRPGAHRSDREHHADARCGLGGEAGRDDRRAVGRALRARRRCRWSRRGLPRARRVLRAAARASRRAGRDDPAGVGG